MVRAALIGIEHPHSLAHLHTLQVLPEIEGIYLWDENATALASTLQAQGAKVLRTFTNLDQLLEQKDLLFAITALRNDISPDICLRLLDAGKHVMAEKPIGCTAAEVERVVVAAERTGLQLGVYYTGRRHPVPMRARELVQAGILGDVVSMETRMVTTQIKFRNPAGWLFSKAQAGGGILSWLACHELDMLHYVTGDEVESVSAEVATLSGEKIDVEDVASLSLRFRSGAIGTLHAGYMLALSGAGYHNPTGYETYYAFRGREGRITWDPMWNPPRLLAESRLAGWSGAPMQEYKFQLRESPAYGGGHGEMFLRDFIRAAQGEGSPPATGRDALRVARIVDAAYESSRLGRRVFV
ncbi:MAG: Gfo/Idh/MocA family oxidoreductase [Chloroflexi bacterium]|nr:Gfo/Idh/MocA family oxidoreductase [Chloroflexota bacterium]